LTCSIESGENIEDNKRNLMMLTQKVFDVIVASSERWHSSAQFVTYLERFNKISGFGVCWRCNILWN